MVNCINLIIEMSPRFILGRKNVPCVAEVVNRSLKADCTDYTSVLPNMILTSTLSIFHSFPATYHLIPMMYTFRSSQDMHDAAHTMMVSDVPGWSTSVTRLYSFEA